MELRELGPGANRPTPQAIFDCKVLDNADFEGVPVRCKRSDGIATDPLPWEPVSRVAGHFFPKRGERATVLFPADGPPVIGPWFPADRVPDVPA